MNLITLTAPAKVNLFLKVLNKRKDGYHDISTLFERVSLADVITLSKRPSGIVVSSDRFITRDPKDNLVYKAAKLILANRRTDNGVKIRIKKGIPIAAGLGGGSSDAASVLIGLNRLYNLKLKQDTLARLGGKLGADVPFFLLRSPFATGTGKGDKLRKMKSRAQFWHLIIYPGFKLATKDVYDAFDLRSRHQALSPSMVRLRSPSTLSYAEGSKGYMLRQAQHQALSPAKGLTTKRDDVKIPRSLRGSFNLKSLERMLYNDLGKIAIAKKNVLKRIIERLAYSLGKKAIISGSGPSVFCLYRTRKEALEARERLFSVVPASERKGWQIFIARTES